MSEEQRLFDIVAAVAYLQSLGATAATPNFVRTLIGTSQIAHLRIGKKYYLRREDLDAWISNHARRGGR